MPQKKADAAQKTLTTRVPMQWMDVLDAARFLRGHDSMQELVRAVIEEFMTKAEREPAVKKALEARREHQSGRVRLIKGGSPDRPEHDTA